MLYLLPRLFFFLPPLERGFLSYLPCVLLLHLFFKMAVLRPSGISVLASFIVLNLLSVIAVILRFVGIQIRSKPTTHHDWLCLVSLVYLNFLF